MVSKEVQKLIPTPIYRHMHQGHWSVIRTVTAFFTLVLLLITHSDYSDGSAGHLVARPHLEVVNIPLCPHDHLAGRDGLPARTTCSAVTEEPGGGRWHTLDNADVSTLHCTFTTDLTLWHLAVILSYPE